MKFVALADEIVAATHRWPSIVAAFLAGSLLGAAVAMIWPSPFRASAELFVGLDPFRAVEDRYVGAYTNVEFRFPDDYKFWQMSQLNALAVSDEYLDETLARLRQESPAWDSKDIRELRAMLQVHWRDPGKWQLVAVSRDADLAMQAAGTWRQVIVERANAAIGHSQSLYLLDLEIQEASRQIVRSRQLVTGLEETKNAVLSWRENHPGGPDNDPFNAEVRNQLVTISEQTGGLEPSLISLLEEMPPAEAGGEEYLRWIDRLIEEIDRNIELNQKLLEFLKRDRAALAAQWEGALHAGRGLAATVTVEKTPEEPDVVQIHSVPLAALVGGVFGLLALGFGWLMIVTRHARKEG